MLIKKCSTAVVLYYYVSLKNKIIKNNSMLIKKCSTAVVLYYCVSLKSMEHRY